MGVTPTHSVIVFLRETDIKRAKALAARLD